MSKFQARHYRVIAKTMARTFPKFGDEAYGEWIKVYSELRDMFREDNPNFDASRFRRACFPSLEETKYQAQKDLERASRSLEGG